MYKFVDVDEMASSTELSIQTIVGGVNLDRTINGFTTLRVDGRELLGRNISTQDFKSISGGGKRETSRNYKASSFSTNKFLGSSLPSRTITVEFSLKASSNKEFRQVFEMLNFYLHNEQMSIAFTDDLGYEFVGTLTSVSEIEASSNSVVGAFSIECSEPFKYSVLKRNFEFESTGKFKFYTLYPVVFSNMVVEFTKEASYFRIENTSTRDFILIDDFFKKGDKLEIDFMENSILKTSEGVVVNAIRTLAMESDLESFNAIFGDEFLCNVPVNVNIYFNERRL